MTTYKHKEDYNYDFYLFARLCVDLKLIDKNLEYDYAYEATIGHYEQFVDSEFNDLEEDYYGCIVEYINYQLTL